MILKDIYLYPDLVEFHDDPATRKLRDQTRSLCNFVGRKIYALKFKTPNFNRICFVGKSQPAEDVYVNSENVLVCEILFSIREYEQKKKTELSEYFINLLEKGLTKASEQVDLPVQEIGSAIAEFRKGEYQNVWLWKSKRVRKISVKLEFWCDLSMDAFSLNLVGIKQGERVFDLHVLDTPPDEIVFRPKLKRVEIENDEIMIVDQSGEPVFKKSIVDLMR